MTIQTRTVLKAKFEQGDTPQGSDYVDLFDSALNLADTTAQTVTSDVLMTQAVITKASVVTMEATNISAASITGFVYGAVTASSIFASALNVWTPSSGGPTNATGTMVMSQTVTVLSSGSGALGIRLPALSQITQMYVHVRSSGSANSQGVTVKVGTSGDFSQFAAIKTTAQGIYMCGAAPNLLGASSANWWTVGANNVQIHHDVTANTSGGQGQADKFDAILQINYVPR